MRNKKGQALVEFILILPILLLFLLAIFDVGTLMYERYHLESNLDVIVSLYQEKKVEEYQSYLVKNKLTLRTEKQENLRTFVLAKTLKFRTPGLNQVFQNKIEVEETIYEK